MDRTQNTTLRRYLAQWLRTAFAPAWDAFGWIGVVVGLSLWVWHRFWPDNFKWTADKVGLSPEAAMSDLVWVIPLVFGASILAYRLIRAPYELHVGQASSARDMEERLRAELERQQRQIASLEQRLHDQGPRLGCTIDQVIIGELPDRSKRTVAFIVTVTNQGGDSVANGWQMFLTLPDVPRRELKIQWSAGPTTFQFEGRAVQIDGTIYDKTAQPVPRGGMVRGYCVSEPLDSSREQIATVGTVFEVECCDVTGRLVHGEWAWSGLDAGIRFYAGLDQRLEPLIPPGSNVSFPEMPLFPIAPLTEEQRSETLEKLASAPSPPLRIDIDGFSFNPLPEAKSHNVQKALPGAGELASPFTFKIRILNTSRERRVDLRFQSFEIVPGYMTAAVITDGIEQNLGPEMGTEGRVTIQLSKSAYGHFTKGNHLKILAVHDGVSNLTARVTVPTHDLERYKRQRDEANRR
jgi:hypothetical protein